MPINIPSGLYTGGRSTFNTSPMTTAILKENALEKARKAAEQKAAKAAIEKNYEKMQTALNPAGARNVDIDDVKDPATGNVIAPGLATMGRNMIQDFIKSGNIDREKMMNFQFAVQQSKNLGKEEDAMHQAALNEKALPTKGDVNLIEEIGYSMFDTRHKPHSVGEMPLFVKDLDEDKWNKAIFGSTKPLTPIGKATMLPGGNTMQRILGYSDKEMKDFADISASLVRTNPSALKTYGEKANNKTFIDLALPLYRKFYGANAEIKTPEDAARASTILEAQGRKEKQESSIYRAPRMAEWEYKALTGGEAAQNELYLNRFIENSYQKGKGRTATIGGQNYSGKDISVPVSMTDRFTVDKGFATEQVPISFMITNDKKTVIPLYQKRDESGKKQFTASGNVILDTNSPYSKPMDVQSFKTELAPFVLRKKTSGEEITEEGIPVQSTTPQTKSTKAVKATKSSTDVLGTGF